MAVIIVALVVSLMGCSPAPSGNSRSPGQSDLRGQSTERLGNELTVRTDVTVRENASGPQILNDLEVAPHFVWLNPGDTITLIATALDQYGFPHTDLDLIWSMVDEKAGAIDGLGNFVGGTLGGYYENAVSVEISQVVDGVEIYLSAYVDVLVEQVDDSAILSDVQTIPANISAYEGQLLRLLALGLDSSDAVIPDALIEWTILDSAVGNMIDQTTIQITAEPGSYQDALQLQAHYHDKTVTRLVSLSVKDSQSRNRPINVRIVPKLITIGVEDTFSFEVIAWDKDGAPFDDISVEWNVPGKVGEFTVGGKFIAGSSPGLYSDAIEAVVTYQDGTTTIVGSAFASVILEKDIVQVLDQVVISTDELYLQPGKAVQLNVFAIGEKGKLISGADVSWEVLDNDVGTISQQGHFRAFNRPGYHFRAVQATVKHNGKQLADTLSLTITGALTQAVIWPKNLELSPGDGVLFHAQGRDAAGVQIGSVLVDFSLSDPNAGDITPYGFFVAGENAGEFRDVVEARIVELLP
jgi:hypothetical protein